MVFSKQIPTRLEKHTQLTPRERETVILLCEGLTRKEIAARLGRSPRVAYQVCADVRLKWDARSMAEIVQKAKLMGIIKA